jgi:hypothetical protein
MGHSGSKASGYPRVALRALTSVVIFEDGESI